MAKKYLIETFGCQMNVHDSERMAGLLEQAGYEPTDADERRRRHRHQHLQRPRAAPKRSSTRGSASCRACSDRPDARRWWPSPAASRSRKAAGCSANGDAHRRGPRHAAAEDAADAGRAGRRAAPRRWSTSPRPGTTSTFPLGITRRGDPVKALRHDHRRLQRPLRLLRRAVHARPRAHARQGRHPRRRARGWRPSGRREIQLLGQIVNHYQAPDDPAATSPRCSATSTTSPGVERIRFASPHPRHYRPRLIEAMRDLPKVCKHLHLPVQSGSTRVLKAMRRRHTREEYLELVDAAARRPSRHRSCRPT